MWADAHPVTCAHGTSAPSPEEHTGQEETEAVKARWGSRKVRLKSQGTISVTVQTRKCGPESGASWKFLDAADKTVWMLF